MAALARWLGASAVLLVLACSGGGGSSGGSGGPTASVGLNSSPGIAAGVVQALFSASEVGAFSESGLQDPDVAPAKFEPPVRPGQDLPPVSRAAFGPTEVDCELDGMVTLSGDVAVPNTLGVGDQVAADFDACDDDIGLVFDGLFDFTIVALVGDLFADAHDASLDVKMTDLLVSDHGEVFVFDGDGLLDIDTTALPLESYGLAGSRLDVGTVTASSTLRSYTTALDIDGGQDPDLYTLSASGRVESSLFSGSVDVETIEDFVWDDGAFPDSGEALLTGASGATVRILVNDSDSVDLELDQDGNGDADGLISDVSWLELFGLL